MARCCSAAADCANQPSLVRLTRACAPFCTKRRVSSPRVSSKQISAAMRIRGSGKSKTVNSVPVVVRQRVGIELGGAEEERAGKRAGLSEHEVIGFVVGKHTARRRGFRPEHELRGGPRGRGEAGEFRQFAENPLLHGRVEFLGLRNVWLHGNHAERDTGTKVVPPQLAHAVSPHEHDERDGQTELPAHPLEKNGTDFADDAPDDDDRHEVGEDNEE